jgi:hypothetical protein
MVIRVLMVAALLVVAGCGSADEAAAPQAQHEPPSSTTSGTVSPEPPRTAGGTAAAPSTKPSPVSGAKPAGKPGAVTVATTLNSYREGEVITVTVANGRDQSIYSEDQKTDCSIVSLEHLAGDRWETVTGCGAERAPLIVELRRGATHSVRIDPTSTNFQGGDGSPAARAGTYRIVFTYRLAAGPEGVEPERVVSPTFRIER